MADPVLSALVVLRPARGQTAGEEPVTAENVARSLPDPAVAHAVRSMFADWGFEVGEVVATAFAITGPRSLFERRLGPSPALDAALSGGAEGLDLPLDRLPPDLAPAVRAIGFSPPPAFGPGNP